MYHRHTILVIVIRPYHKLAHSQPPPHFRNLGQLVSMQHTLNPSSVLSHISWSKSNLAKMSVAKLTTRLGLQAYLGTTIID